MTYILVLKRDEGGGVEKIVWRHTGTTLDDISSSCFNGYDNMSYKNFDLMTNKLFFYLNFMSFNIYLLIDLFN